uniref:collagen alpha-3(VI) chain-like n=1 Tax=Semicossyphus pulcher TaxID=241346 RepID=UPI0037E88BB8
MSNSSFSPPWRLWLLRSPQNHQLYLQLQSSVEAVVAEVAPESPTVPVDTGKKDVVFLLDGSDGTRNGFPAMRDFVERVVEQLNVGQNKDRVSVVQYSRDAEIHFYLNTYTTSQDILDTVRGLKHRGGRPLNTGAALQYVRDNVFTNSSGSRRLQGVPQMLILLNGGRSSDNVDTPASALKQQGIQVFLLDGSDGTRSGFPAVRDFVQRVVETLSVDDKKDRVSVVQYSKDPTVQFYLNTYTTKGDILDTVRGLRHKGGSPLNTGAALQYLRDNVFTASAGSRLLEGVPQLLILISGGRSFDSVDAPASALKQLGVLTFVIGTRNSDIRELQKISHDPSYAQTVSEFTDLPNVQQQLQSSVEAVVAEVAPESPTAVRDFVQRVVETLSVDDKKDRVSVVQYSKDPTVQFYLNTYTTKGDILDTVRGLRHKGGRPLNTGAALQYLRDNVFTASAGSRLLEGVPQLLILISGGRSFDSVDAPASALKQLGVLTFAIGTRNSDIGELQKISHDPSYAQTVSEFTDLPNVQQQLQSSVEAVVAEVAPESPTVPVDTGKKDVVFLLDGSDGTRNGFPAMRDFVERVVEKLNVGQNKDRVSVVQYSRDAEIHFYLNTYTTSQDILDTVRGLKHRGGRPLNTGAALQYVRDNVFTNSSGSRRLQGVPQMLILLNGGRSSDNVDTPASALKQQGIQVIGIGTRNSDSRELQKISYDPSYALSVSDFTDLPSVQEQLSSVMSRVLVRTTPMTPTVTDRVSVVQYSKDPTVQFYLNTYTTKGDILDTVRGLRHKGGSPLNTGAALQYLRDNVFTASAGSRLLEGVPQLLILISGGRSFDSVDAPASALKQLGVLTFAIGTRNSDIRELQKISHDPSYAQTVSEFTDLPNVQQQLQSSVEAVVAEVAPESPTVPGM